MKKLYPTFLFLWSIISLHAQVNISGTVTESSTGSPLIGANIILYEDDLIVASLLSDIDGYYELSSIAPGKYDAHVSYIGYETITRRIIVKKDIPNQTFDFALNAGALLDEVVVTKSSYKPSRSISDLPTRDINAMSAVATGLRTRDGGSYASHVPMETTTAVFPSSGQVTAGEWNDLHNWKDWMKLLEDENYAIMTERYAIYPTKRYAVIVVNKENNVLPNIPVQLLDRSGMIIWEAVTDNAGKAELWSSPFGEKASPTTIKAGGTTLSDILSIEEGSNTIVLDKSCDSPSMVDVVFAVDATSSMSDEIQYLKAELLDVVDRIKDADKSIDFHLGSVFYRDTGDEYLTRETPLTRDHTEVLDFIGAQSANGGGDTPEAVDEALQKALELNWRSDALKMVFLLLDAPPHDDEITMNRLRLQIKEASARGIKIIPITASGINRNTEFLMKFMAIMTNGTYVFITDDSGIGNAHLAPIVEDYEVEKLNDCIVRLISSYSTPFSCEAQENAQDLAIKVFPNPSTEFITVETDTTPDKIQIFSASGMIVKTISSPSKQTRIDLSDLINGIYTVRVTSGNEVRSSQIILLK